MGTDRSRVVIVKDPSALPGGLKHHRAVDALATTNKAVVLMSHGNKYKFPKGWILPGNVTLLEYDLENGSIEKCVIRLREILRGHGIDVHSRHLAEADPMPMPLAGSVLVMNIGTEIAFINEPVQYTKDLIDVNNEYEPNEWDIL